MVKIGNIQSETGLKAFGQTSFCMVILQFEITADQPLPVILKWNPAHTHIP